MTCKNDQRKYNRTPHYNENERFALSTENRCKIKQVL